MKSSWMVLTMLLTILSLIHLLSVAAETLSVHPEAADFNQHSDQQIIILSSSNILDHNRITSRFQAKYVNAQTRGVEPFPLELAGQSARQQKHHSSNNAGPARNPSGDVKILLCCSS